GGPFLGPFRIVSYLPIFRYPAPRVDRRFEDRATIRVGPVQLTAHVTAGHTPGCTSWSIPVHHGDRDLQVVLICGLTPPPALSLGEYPEIRAGFERSFRTLRSLPADIFLTPHAREFGRWRKYQESLEAEDPVEPFIDPEGYARYIDRYEERFRDAIAD
ncbi:MAG: hypothetical protein R3282_04250, partial [Rhodothermales bacterium]|nr:hypothetical protein [Rhodothermales bacterium]